VGVKGIGKGVVSVEGKARLALYLEKMAIAACRPNFAIAIVRKAERLFQPFILYTKKGCLTLVWEKRKLGFVDLLKTQLLPKISYTLTIETRN